MTKLMIIDGNSLANRAYYGVPALSNSKGVVTNAVYGFINMLLSVIEREQPDKLLVAFDVGKKVFRHEQYEDYKGTRKGMPDDLRSQMDLIREALRLMRIETFGLEGYEADDVLGTVSLWAEQQGFETILVSGDRDLFQLISDKTVVFYPRRGLSDVHVMDIAALKEEYDLTPEQVIELKGLKGDSSDNIPGIPGVGDKTARKLLDTYGSLENLYDHLEDFKGKKLGEKLLEHKDTAFLSRSLATIERAVPMDCDALSMAVETPDVDGLLAFYRELDLHNLVKQLEQRYAETPAETAQDNTTYDTGTILTDAREIEVFLKALTGDEIVITLQPTEDDAALFHLGVRVQDDNFLMQVKAEQLRLLEPVLEDQTHYLITDDAKALYHHMYALNININGVIWDAVLSDYLLYPEGKEHQLERMVIDYFGQKLPEDPTRCRFATLYWLSMLRPVVNQQLVEREQWTLYQEVELPLAALLADMEICGVRVDVDYLRELQKEFGTRIHDIEEGIYVMAGETFNLNSPKQLGRILFDVLGLSVQKKTKTGYSTSAEVLEVLKHEHGIVNDILEYRQINKLKNTYVDGLLKMADDRHLVHTTFNQTVTATGRLSSTEPNLQNIPIRTAEGQRIRKAFLPSERGQVLISADYSQIELRVLAHMSYDERLIESFRNGEDIHRRTASEVFHVAMDEVTAAQRRAAKAVNFGIIYGQTDYGLARELGILRQEAQEYIDHYFARYPDVHGFMEHCKDSARANGYVATLLGRRRYIRDIHSKNHNLRSFAERTAINSPIQGSAADIIKLAMIDCDRRMQEEEFTARMILQVHDELIFEAPPEEVAYLIQVVRAAMENAISLHVPLVADIKVGFNWHDMERI